MGGVFIETMGSYVKVSSNKVIMTQRVSWSKGAIGYRPMTRLSVSRFPNSEALTSCVFQVRNFIYENRLM